MTVIANARSALILCLAFAVSACDNWDNYPPEFTSGSAVSVPEGSTDTGYTAIATDRNRKDAPTFSVSGGPDAAQFSIGATSGVLSFVAVTDYSNPADANGDNVYEVELTADDGRKRNNAATLNLTVTVTSVNEPPVFTSAAAVDVTEGSTATGYTATADDPNGDALSFSVSGGADEAQFAIDGASGVLSFAAAPDFAAPADTGADNVYDVQLTADDGRGGTDVLDVAVTVLEMGNLSLRATFPTPNANLGGGVTQTTVTGNIIDSNGLPINLAEISYVTVNSVAATLDLVNEGRWSVQVPVTEGPNTLDLELGLAGGSVAKSSQVLHNFVVHTRLSFLDLDNASDRLLVIDNDSNSILAVDLASGDREIFSGSGTGAGTEFSSPGDVVVDGANSRALVIDGGLRSLLAVDLATGGRTVLSNHDSSGPYTAANLAFPQYLALDSANNRAFVLAGNGSANKAVVAIDLATGDRTVISGEGIGTGPEFNNPNGLATDDATNRAFVSNYLTQEIIAIDLTSGVRTILSDSANGTGPSISAVTALSVDAANNRLLASNIRGTLYAVDMTSGDRTILVDLRSNYGRYETSFASMAPDYANDRVLVTDGRLDAIHAIDLATSDHVVVSSSATGSGPTIANPLGWVNALDAVRNRVLVADPFRNEVTAVDLGSGDWSIQSGVGDSSWAFAIDTVTDRAALAAATALHELDLSTGARELLSSNSGPGAGPNFNKILDVGVDFTNNRATVLDDTAGLLNVALDTGDRSVISDSVTGTGPMWERPRSLVVDFAAGMAYVGADGAAFGNDAVFSVDLSTGDREVISDNTAVGTGPTFYQLTDMKLDAAGDRLLVANFNGRRLIAVDLPTGDRSVVFEGGLANSYYYVPATLEWDSANNRVFSADYGTRAMLVIDLASGESAIMSKH